ncbi:hypothetical protein ACQRIT_004179 [Beauveria bassiana]
MLEMHVELDHEISAAGRMHEDCFMSLQTDAPAVSARLHRRLRRPERVARHAACRAPPLPGALGTLPRHLGHPPRLLVRRAPRHQDFACCPLEGRRRRASLRRYRHRDARVVVFCRRVPGHRSGTSPRRHENGHVRSAATAAATAVCLSCADGGLNVPGLLLRHPATASFPSAAAAPVADAASHARLLHPHHHHHDVAAAPATSQDMYYDLGAGGYMAMAAPDFGPVSDLDTLLYSTEGVNWVVPPPPPLNPSHTHKRPLAGLFQNPIDQFLRVRNNNNEEGWFDILQGV